MSDPSPLWVPVHLTAFAGDKGAAVTGHNVHALKLSSSGEWETKPLENNSHTELIRAIRFSHNGQYLAVGGDDKLVSLWDSTAYPFTFIGGLVVEKKVTGIAFAEGDEVKVVVSDRFGNVFAFDKQAFSESKPFTAYNGSSAKADNSLYLLVGMYSWITDCEIATKTRSDATQATFVLSPTRDEKMQVAHFPDGYDIAAYCMGHTEYMSCVRDLGEGFAVSGGGDGKVFVWDYETGASIQDLLFSDQKILAIAVSQDKTSVAVVCENDSKVYTYNVENHKLKENARVDVPSIPLHVSFRGNDIFVSLFDGTVSKITGLNTLSPATFPALSTGTLPDDQNATTRLRTPYSKYETTSKIYLQSLKSNKKRRVA